MLHTDTFALVHRNAVVAFPDDERLYVVERTARVDDALLVMVRRVPEGRY